MCGITGIISLNGNTATLDESALRAMTDRLVHRGPDGCGFHTDGQCMLGHRRLSIIDLETGDQPMFAAAGDLCIVFNGEIYNYVELRDALIQDGYQFSTNSDTEVILHLYHQRGAAALQALDGMFAFAIWSRSAQTLFLARDRLGEKPLYYWHSEQQLIFASELKALLQHPAVPTEIDPRSVGRYLACGYVPGAESIYANVNRLPPAHWMTFSAAGRTLEPYWHGRSASAHAGIDQASDDDMLAQLDGLLEQSVRRRLRSDVPVGAFLSGGVDSSLIVHHAAAHYSGTLQTFTVTFDEQSVDESRYAREVSAICGTDHHELRVGDFGTEILPSLVASFDEPFADPSSLPTYYVTRAAGERLKVCLSGDAGDELFGGYIRYGSERFEQLMLRFPEGLRRPLLSVLSRALPDRQVGKGWLQRMASSELDRYLHRIWLFDPLEVQNLVRSDFVMHCDSAFQEYRQLAQELSEARDWPLLFDQQTYLPDDILVKTDRNSMRNSLELRVPLLDHNIVEFANSLSAQQKMRAGELKYPLKALARRHFPKHIVNRRKQGFGLPLNDWFSRGPLLDSYRELVCVADAHVAAFLEPQACQNLLRDHLRGGRDLGSRLWAILWLELWCRHRTA